MSAGVGSVVIWEAEELMEALASAGVW